MCCISARRATNGENVMVYRWDCISQVIGTIHCVQHPLNLHRITACVFVWADGILCRVFMYLTFICPKLVVRLISFFLLPFFPSPSYHRTHIDRVFWPVGQMCGIHMYKLCNVRLNNNHHHHIIHFIRIMNIYWMRTRLCIWRRAYIIA